MEHVTNPEMLRGIRRLAYFGAVFFSACYYVPFFLAWPSELSARMWIALLIAPLSWSGVMAGMAILASPSIPRRRWWFIAIVFCCCIVWALIAIVLLGEIDRLAPLK